MNVIARRVTGFAALILFAVALAACGDSEADQRQAFIKFLQEINHRAGVHFLLPKPEERKAFGDYAHHYEIIEAFNARLKSIYDDMTARIEKLGLGPATHRTIGEIATHRGDIVAMRGILDTMLGDIDASLAKVNAERDALKQPDDLKAVYSVTFDRLITTPAHAMHHSQSVLRDGLGASLQLADYINSHAGKLTVSGSQVRATDQKTLDEVRALLQNVNDAAKDFQNAQREGQKLLDQ